MRKFTVVNYARSFVVVMFLFLSASTFADVRLPGILASNMVLQRDNEIVIWGWADKGEKVNVTFNELTKKTKADAQGKWKVVFPAMPAGGPFKMLVQGKNTIPVENILIGDVWVCSGQSNMAWILKDTNEAEKEISSANYPSIRLITITRNFQKEPVEDVEKLKWVECSPEIVSNFSAVAYYFGKNLSQETNIPIGLINTSWGGTNIEAWTSMDYLVKIPKFNKYPLELAEKVKIAASNEAEAKKLFLPNAYHSSLYNGMIYPLINLGVKGAIWYQGESNASQAYLYRSLFPNMIECWRDKFNNPEMPFLFVQLANYMEETPEPVESAWAELREAQTMTLSLPNTGMAVIIDIGEAKDIHPRNKKDVGYRLALNGLKIAYDKNIVSTGPLYKSMEVEGNKAVINFNGTGSGLIAKNRYGYVNSFAVAGADKKFHWAKAEIKGDKVIVWSDDVENPVAVRYAWANNPADANLYNTEGLPASPFRTDDWDGVTQK